MGRKESNQTNKTKLCAKDAGCEGNKITEFCETGLSNYTLKLYMYKNIQKVINIKNHAS